MNKREAIRFFADKNKSLQAKLKEVESILHNCDHPMLVEVENSNVVTYYCKDCEECVEQKD